MYMIMNQDQNQSHAPNTVNAYGNIEHGTIVTESVPPPLQPLQNYTTYELVGQDTGHVIFPNETTNIIVSAMQVPGQDDLVFFHDQTVGDLASYSIEIQDPNPVTNIPAIEYYPEQHQTQRVMSYETLQQSPQQTHMMSPMQDQNIVLQQQMCQTQSLPQQQQQPQQQEQHVVETQLPPSGQILKQQLQGSPPQSQQLPPIRSQVQITPVMQQQPRPRMMQQQPQQQTHLQQPVYVQQQQGPSPHHQQQQAQQQQQFVVQNQQLQQQQQFVQQNHPQGAKLVQNQQHFVQKQMPMQQQNVQQHFVQQKQMVQNQHFVLQQQQPKQMVQQHYVQQKQMPMQQQGQQQHFVQQGQHVIVNAGEHGVINQAMDGDQRKWEQHQNQMHMNHQQNQQQQQSPNIQYSNPPTPDMQQQLSPQQQQQMQQQQMNHQQQQQQQPQQQAQYSTVYQVLSPMSQPGSPRLRGPTPPRNRTATPRTPGPGAPRSSPRAPNNRPRVSPAPRPRPPQLRVNGPVTLTNIRQQGPPLRQYAPQRFVQSQQQQRFMTNNIQEQQLGQQQQQQQLGQQQQQLGQQQQQQQLGQQQQLQINKQPGTNVIQQLPINNGGPKTCIILKNGTQLVQIPQSAGSNPSPGEQMYVEQEGGDNAVKIKAVVLPKMNQMQGSPGVMKVQGAPGTPSGPGPKTTVQEISTGELKNFKILVAPNGTQLPSRVRSPMSPAQGQRLLNVATNIRQVNVGVSQEFRIMPGCGSPRPQYVQSPRPRNMTPRPPTLLQRSMSPRPQQMYNRMPPPNQQVCDNPMEPPPPSMESTPAPVEEEKDQYKAGFLALCSNCGSLSARTNRCNRCNHKIPPDCKLVSSNGNPTAGGGAGPKGGKDTPASPGDSKNSPKPANAVNSPSHPSTDTAPATPNPPSGTKTRARKAQEEPPEILLISSDEEDDGESENKHTPVKSFPTPLSDKEPQMNEYEMPQNIRVCGGGIPDDNVLDTLSEDGRYTHLLCRTIRIGSLKVFPTERVFISRHGIKLTLPLNQTQVTVKIYRHEIVKVLAHFGKGMPVIFYYIRARVGPRIREQLNMTKNSKFYFDPSSPDETHRRITLLPEKIPDEVKCILSDIYSKTSSGSEEPQDGPCLEELSIKEANNILVKSSPPELRNVNSAAPPIPAPVSQPVQTIYIYKPTGISINTEDYACLDKEQFINDVIIDFYLGFLLQEMATPHIREKTHIFSTFFYKRLTQKPTRKISGSIEGDPHISAAKKRHSRVQSWTKNINVFEKDFIVVPINSNAHWFLAIICFPGLKGCETPEGRAVEECQRFRSLRKRERIKLDEMQKTGKASGSVTIGNTTISPVTKAPGTPASTDPAAATSLLVNDEEEENRDEAESEGEDFVQFGEESQEAAAGANSSGERAQSPLRDFDGPVRHPCILIFDSLPQAGNSRVRVVATLRDWLAVEYQVKHGGATRDFSKNVFIGAKPKVPMQTNYYDCGLYLLHYAERFFLDPLTDYRMPILLEDWFSVYDTSRKRYDLQHLLFVLMERQGIDRNSLNLPHLNLDDPDYKSPEHEPEAIESKYSASQDSQEEEGREEAEGEEMGDEEEEEEELEEGEIRGGRRGGEATNCDNNSSTEDADIELQMKVVEEEVSDEQDTTVSECTEVDEPCSEEEEKAASTPLARGNTKQITITPMGVKLKQISVTPALNSPTVQIVHIPRPRSKQILVHSPAAGGASAVPARRILVPSSVESPGAGSASPARRILVPSSESPGAGTGTPARRIMVPSSAESPGAGAPPAAKKLIIPADKDSLDLLKNNKNITVKRKLGPASALKKSPPLGGTGAGGNSLRNMRIVKKMKTEDSGGVEEEEEMGS